MTKFKAKLDTRGLDRKVAEAAQTLREQVHDLKREVAEDAEFIFAAHALKGATGRLSRGISTVDLGDSLLIRADARSDRGYDYVGVTRFGHRKQWIVPTHAPKADRFYPKTAQAFPLPFGFRRWIHGFAALATPFGYRRRVRGFHPKRDWAEEALPEVQAVAEEKLATFGRGFVVKMS